MHARPLPRALVAALICALSILGSGVLAAPAGAAAPAPCVTFPETGKQVCDRFLAYWQQHGGLAQQGLPLTDPFIETNPSDGRPYLTQYFERARFELHPENAPPYDVLLGLLGSEQYGAKYPAAPPPPFPGDPFNTPAFPADCATFAETGKTVCSIFLAYWREHGGLAQQGLPLTEVILETNPTDGRPYPTQYFERARFEYHAEHLGTPYAVLLGLLGREQLLAKYPGGAPRAAAPRGAANLPDVPNTTPAAAATLIEQAVNNLLAYYVEPLRSGPLYQAAYAGAIVTLWASGASPQARPVAFTDEPRRDAATFRAAYLALNEPLDPAINQSVVAYQAIEAVVATIDECHTYFLDPEQHRRAKAQRSGQETYVGIGVQIDAVLRPPTITRVFKGSPAEAAGLRAGDAIVAIDGLDVSDLSIDEAGPLIRGEEGTQVRLTIRRAGEAAPFTVTITRARITSPVFEQRIVEGPNGERIGVMELYSFSATTGLGGVGAGVERDIQAALEGFERAGVRYWVLDLRNNPGGYVETLRRVASRFIPDGKPVIYYVEGDGQTYGIPTDRNAYFTPQHPFAVLINSGSASASEAFAAAAQDYGFARVFGQRSAGCLAAGRTYELADGSAINITVEQVVSPLKRAINRVGVTPDEVILPDPARREDPVLQGAIRWLVAQPQPPR